MDNFYKEPRKSFSHENITIDETSRDSGVCLDLDAWQRSPSSYNVQQILPPRMFSPDFDRSPSKENSPFSFGRVPTLNFEMDTPEKSTLGNSTPSLPGSFNSLFSSAISKDCKDETPKSRRLATQFRTLHIRSRANRKRESPSQDARELDATPNSKRPCGSLFTRRCQSLEVAPSPKPDIDDFCGDQEAVIMEALDRVSEDADLISDGSRACCLPTIAGKHQDLKSITPETLSRVLNHEFDDEIENFVIVDCRYPYEFDGGHIQGAKNLYTKDSIMEHLVDNPVCSTNPNKRTVLIFHCEFSSERGPKMSRFLRTQDRKLNADKYPFLFYPEVYLLHGGYKNFYQTQKEFCFPQSYMPMHHEDYKADLKRFRVKSKSWAGEKPKGNLRKGLRF